MSKPTLIDCPDSDRLELLQRLAAYGTREMNRSFGVNFEDVREAARGTVSFRD